LVLQIFLDNTPEYWCLVPLSHHEARLDDEAYDNASNISIAAVTTTHQLPESPTFAKKPMFFAQVLGGDTRSNEESVWFSKGVPKPPFGYRFSCRQIQEQIDFFKYKKESRVLPTNLVDLYNYAIVAVCKS
jgi:hypothetical protein